MEDNKEVLPTSKEVEESLLKEQQPELPPEVIASKMIELYAEPFGQKLKELTTGELRRLSKSLALFPIIDEDFLGYHPESRLKEANAMGHSLIQAKIMLFHKAVSDKMEKEVKELNQGEKNE